MALSQKDLTIFLSTWKPKCDQQNGMYNNTNDDPSHTVFSFKPDIELFYNIVNDEKKVKWINDNGYTIDPTWDSEKGSLIPRIKRVFHVDAKTHFDKDLCNLLNIPDLPKIIETWNESQINSYNSLFDIYNKQFKVAFAQKQKSICLNELGGKKPSKALNNAVVKLAKHMNISYEEAFAIIG